VDDADEYLAIAARFMQALEACDLDAVREIYASDARLWHNFDQQLQSVEDNIKTLQWIHRKLDNLKYDIVRAEPIPGGYYQQHVLRGTLANGAPFAMPACAIVKVERGKIVALDEYLDSAHTLPLRESAGSPSRR
jgi:ketosteroid isomerase-like protein